MVKAVAEDLGNTPAVARSSYIDPRVVDRFLDEGVTVDLGDLSADEVDLDRVDGAVLALLRGEDVGRLAA